MKQKEIKVLGTPEKRKLTLSVIAAIAVIAITIGAGFYWIHSSQQSEKIKADKEIGESTIVPKLQHAVDSLLRDELEMIGGLQGQAIVMEVQTGKILAMVGLERNLNGCYQLCNNIAYQQELGEFAMAASLLAALETGTVKLSDVVNVGNGVLTIGKGIDLKDHNWHCGGYGELTIGRALEMHSNIGIGKAVVRAFSTNQQAYFDKLNEMSYGQPIDIAGVEGLKPTTYSSPKDPLWVKRNIWQSAIGYGRKIAPIQMLTFYNAIANGGKMMKPTLHPNNIEVINSQIASKENIDSVRIALEYVVSQGLGKKTATPLMKVAGQGSTSQVNEYYVDNDEMIPEFQMGFCGYFPVEKPQYSMIVSMNKIAYPANGGAFAGPVFSAIAEWMFNHGMISKL